MNADDLQRLIDQSGRLQTKAAERARMILQEVRKQLAGEIASTPWQMHHLAEMKRAVNDALNEFSARYSADLSDSHAEAWSGADEVILSQFEGLGLSYAAPELSMTQLDILQAYSADLITGLGQDAIKQISTELTLGIMSGKTLNETMEKIGRNLTDPSVFKNIATRAEVIARTETARVYTASRQARIEAVEKTLKDSGSNIVLYKKWIHSGNKNNPRKNHMKLNGKVVKLSDKFPGGFDYPHAPGMPAKEVINCRCVHVILFPGMPGYPEK